MRGTHRLGIDDRGYERFIPAHAGNTRTSSSGLTLMTVHPRACGEHSSTVNALGLPSGSSPRMRGTRTLADSGAQGTSVHPRACGEHFLPFSTSEESTGSSPRMRGTQRWRMRGGGGRRFIPAHAGNTTERQRTADQRPVHPRACGEHIPKTFERRLVHGSSPRMRGTPDAIHDLGAKHRFIPAHAGNTPVGIVRRFKRPVHPRACGEHGPPAPAGWSPGGSSPRMRGTQSTGLSLPFPLRFIPAHAGNTSIGRLCFSVCTVHPRACGEHASSPDTCPR